VSITGGDGQAGRRPADDPALWRRHRRAARAGAAGQPDDGRRRRLRRLVRPSRLHLHRRARRHAEADIPRTADHQERQGSSVSGRAQACSRQLTTEIACDLLDEGKLLARAISGGTSEVVRSHQAAT